MTAAGLDKEGENWSYYQIVCTPFHFVLDFVGALFVTGWESQEPILDELQMPKEMRKNGLTMIFENIYLS